MKRLRPLGRKENFIEHTRHCMDGAPTESYNGHFLTSIIDCFVPMHSLEAITSSDSYCKDEQFLCFHEGRVACV